MTAQNRTNTDPANPYRSPGARARLAMIFLLLYGVVTIAGIVSTLMEIDLLQQIDSRVYVSQDDILANDNRQALIGLINLGSLGLAAVTFLMWLYRASKNLAPLGTQNQQYSPGWTMAYWFIPIVSLFRPYQAVAEIWSGSLPEPYSGIPAASAELPTSPLLMPWWVAWVIGVWFGNFATIIWFGDAITVQELIVSDVIAVLSSSVLLISLVLVLILIWQITKNQQKRHTQRTPLS